jgi:hypothetical protein
MEFAKSEVEALWCPWRVEYFELENRNPNFLSDAARTNDDPAHLVLTRRKNTFLMMIATRIRSAISWSCPTGKRPSFRR